MNAKDEAVGCGDGAKGRPDAKPRVFLLDSIGLPCARLAEMLPGVDCTVIEGEDEDSLQRLLAAPSDPPRLLLMTVLADGPTRFESIRELRLDPLLREIPILGITTVPPTSLNFDELRDLGVVGLVNRSASVEHVAFRINGIVRPHGERRRFERAVASLPVELRARGTIMTGTITSLSVGGLGVRTAQPLEANTAVQLCFQLPESTGELLDVAGRIVRCDRLVRGGDYRLGLFFYPLEERTLALLEEAVRRLLNDTPSANIHSRDRVQRPSRE